MSKFLVGLLAFIVTFSLIDVASAHVVVRPSTVEPGAFQTFTAGVPNEKDQPVTALRVVIPNGLKFVSPTVKPGWTLSVTKDGEGESANVTEISWTGGSIPAGQRDDFTFSAQAPASTGLVIWKAYQTYADGTVVAWDQDPTAHEGDNDTVTPYSQTSIQETSESTTDTSSNTLATSALVVGIIAILLHLRRR